MICDTAGEQLLVGDKLGSVHIWRLINQEPKLILVKEGLVEVRTKERENWSMDVRCAIEWDSHDHLSHAGDVSLRQWTESNEDLEKWNPIWWKRFEYEHLHRHCPNRLCPKLKETFGSIQSVCLVRRGSDSMFLTIGTRLNYILWKDLQQEQIDVIMRVSEARKRDLLRTLDYS